MKYICFFVLALVIACAGCSNASDARRALTAAGFTDIETHGYAFFACGEDDTFATKFTATNPRGDRVEGAVCSSLLFKDATIRY